MANRTANNIRELIDQSGLGVKSLGEFGRAIYKATECGPWLSFELNSGRSLYYGDAEAQEPNSLNFAVIAIKVGSIVEGSDAEVGPHTVRFPMDTDLFWDTVGDVNDEACALWEDANG